jgi:hypothetical protein
MASLPYAQMVSPGYSVQSVQLIPVQNGPGLPAGITTSAAVVLALPTADASTPSPSTSPAGDPGACADITEGVACTGYELAGPTGMILYAEYEYEPGNGSSTEGKLNLGISACPGTHALASTGLITLKANEEALIDYDVVPASYAFDSRWWHYTGSEYVSWGYVCYGS